MAYIVFDSCHNEYLRIGRKGLHHFGPKSGRFDWTRLGLFLADIGHTVGVLDRGVITENALCECDILVLGSPESHFFHSKQPAPRGEISIAGWERWGVLHASEIQAIERFVAGGGGLLVLQEHGGDAKRGTNLNDLAAKFGIRFEENTVKSDKNYQDNRSHVLVNHFQSGHELFNAVHRLVYFEGCSLLAEQPARVVAQADPWAFPRDAGLIAICEYELGRVVAMGDATMFSEWGLGSSNEFARYHLQFVFNLFAWLSPRRQRELEDGTPKEATVVGLTEGLLASTLISGELVDLENEIRVASSQQHEMLDLLSKKLNNISAKIGVRGGSPVGEAILTLIYEYAIVLGGFMLGFLLTESLAFSSPTSLATILILSIVVVVLIRVIEAVVQGRP